jgi:hypothetical protein
LMPEASWSSYAVMLVGWSRTWLGAWWGVLVVVGCSVGGVMGGVGCCGGRILRRGGVLVGALLVVWGDPGVVARCVPVAAS